MRDTTETIDEVDYAVLKVIQDAGQPLWKKRVHDLIGEREDQLPLLGNVSVQTVGRRIDSLHNERLLENVIVRPDNIDRDMVIAYELTEDGEDTLTEKRRAYLRDIVRQDIFIDFRDEDLPQGPLLQAMKDEFDLSDASVHRLEERFDSVQLASILALYYLEIETEELLTEQERRLVRQVARSEKELDEAVDEME